MAKHTDLTAEASEGYNAPEGTKSPYLWSSASHMAWEVGAWLQRTGRTAPRDVRMGRGYQVHANDMLMAWNDKNEVFRVR